MSTRSPFACHTAHHMGLHIEQPCVPILAEPPSTSAQGKPSQRHSERVPAWSGAEQAAAECVISSDCAKPLLKALAWALQSVFLVGCAWSSLWLCTGSAISAETSLIDLKHFVKLNNTVICQGEPAAPSQMCALCGVGSLQSAVLAGAADRRLACLLMSLCSASQGRETAPSQPHSPEGQTLLEEVEGGPAGLTLSRGDSFQGVSHAQLSILTDTSPPWGPKA